MNLDGLAVLAFVFLPPLLVIVLKRTWLFWVPGAGLIVLGMIALAGVKPDEGGHGGPAVFGDGLGPVIAAVPIVYGVICLAVAGWKYASRPQPPVVVPSAIVVTKVSKT